MVKRSSLQYQSLLRSFVVYVYVFVWGAVSLEVHGERRSGWLYSRHRGRCTPLYWSSRKEAWPRMVPQRSTISKVFGYRANERFRSDLTLLEATARNDDVENPFVGLLKQSSAALLNSYARVGYPFRAWEVKSLVLMGLVSERAAARQAQVFKRANEVCN